MVCIKNYQKIKENGIFIKIFKYNKKYNALTIKNIKSF